MSTTTPIAIGNLRTNAPVLTGINNFRRWYQSWIVILRGARYWTVVSDGEDKEVRPVKQEGELDSVFKQRLENYDERNDSAHAALLAGVSEDLQMIVSSCVLKPESARLAMRLLKEKYDHDTTTSTLELFNSFLELKMEEDNSISDHLSAFETSFTHIHSRSSESSRPEAIALKNFLAVEEVKIMCLFRSLPLSLNNVVDNLSTKDNLKYSDVHKRLMDLQSNRLSNVNHSSKAYFAGKSHPKEIQRKKNSEKILECTWCRKYGKKYIGHAHNNCSKLREFKQQHKSPQENKSYKPNLAHAVAGPSVIPSENFYELDLDYEKAFLSSLRPSQSHWILDSGCSAHMTSQKNLLTSVRPHKGIVTLANGAGIPVEGIGMLHLRLRISSGEITTATIQNVLYVPKLKGGNLISESKLELSGCKIFSELGHRKVFKKGVEWMYAILDESNQFILQDQKYKAAFTSYLEAHKCFGHPGETSMTNLKQRYPDLIPRKPEGFVCPSCILSKSTHKSGKPSQKRSSKPFEIIHSDLSGKFSVDSLGGKRYYITFIDDFTRYSWIYFLRNKNDAYQSIREFIIRIKNQFNTTIKKIFSDNGGEYIDNRVTQFLIENGVEHEFSPPYEHDSNGIAERFNRTIVTKARTMLLDFPKFLWAESIATSVYLYNRTPHRTNEYQTPIEILNKSHIPEVTHLHPFGCKVYVHIPVESRPSGSKLQPKSIEGIFVGYTGSSKIFRVFIPSKGIVLITRPVLSPTPTQGK